MATMTIEYAAASNLTVTALDALASSSTHVTGAELGPIDNTSNKYLDYLISGKFTLESAGLATSGEIRVYVVPMLDDSTWPGGFDGTASTETTPLDDENGTAAGAVLGWSCATDATASQVYYMAKWSVARLFGGVCPSKFMLFVTHSTTAALETGGHQVTYQGVYYNVA